jgi:hypothetical protein
MAKYRKIPQDALPPIVAEIKRLRVAAVSTNFHLQLSKDAAGTTLAITSANATDLATLLTLTNELIGKGKAHLTDTGAHKVTDPIAWPAFGAAVDLATANTALNLMKASHGTHIASTTFHYNADATNTIAAADATDQGSAQTLANELKTDLTAHIASGLAGETIELY